MGKIVFVLLLLALLVAACGAPAATVTLAPSSDLSPALRQTPPQVQEAYRFALANRDTLDKIPCYCGCGNIGHTSNYACYVQPQTADGQVVFDHHAVG